MKRRPTIGLVWAAPSGEAVAVRPFKFSKNRRPAVRPLMAWVEVYADVPVSGTPNYPKSPDGWR